MPSLLCLLLEEKRLKINSIVRGIALCYVDMRGIFSIPIVVLLLLLLLSNSMEDFVTFIHRSIYFNAKYLN